VLYDQQRKGHGLQRRSTGGVGYKYDGNVAYNSFPNKAGKYRGNTIACGTYQQSCTFLGESPSIDHWSGLHKREVESRIPSSTPESKHIEPETAA
jgi:hypothetical protein